MYTRIELLFCQTRKSVVSADREIEREIEMFTEGLVSFVNGHGMK